MMIQRFLDALPTGLPESPVILDVGSYTGEQACGFATVIWGESLESLHGTCQ